MLGRVAEVKKVADAARRERIKHVVLLGMGGSSLCPEVSEKVFGAKAGYPELVVLDTTSPEAIRSALQSMDIRKALFIVASKSGGTVETMSLYRFFNGELEKQGVANPGNHFVAITDPGTSLEKLAKAQKFRALFVNPADIGGRYSALSMFGLVPMALIGVDIEKLLKRAVAFSADLPALVPVQAEPAVRLGAVLGTLAKEGRDKLSLIASDKYAPMGAWIEQLIAESTGKHGKGILPVDLEREAPVRKYGSDRVFVTIEDGKDSAIQARAEELQAAGHPVVRIRVNDVYDLGAEFLRWEIATAVAGASLQINPFDEPNVSEAKANTNALLEEYENHGAFPVPAPLLSDKKVRVSVSDAARKGTGKAKTVKQAVAAIADTAKPGDYISLLAFIPSTDANRKALERAAVALRDRTGCPVTIGFGPRYLHSTGQLHKGGANNGVFIVIVDEVKRDLEIPGSDYTFGTLIRAQGIGDFRTLEHHDRRALLIDLADSKLSAGTLV
jgi:glucose-6-phosphate isomerase